MVDRCSLQSPVVAKIDQEKFQPPPWKKHVLWTIKGNSLSCVNFFSAMILILCFIMQKLLHMFYIRGEIITHFCCKDFPSQYFWKKKKLFQKNFSQMSYLNFAIFQGGDNHRKKIILICMPWLWAIFPSCSINFLWLTLMIFMILYIIIMKGLEMPAAASSRLWILNGCRSSTRREQQRHLVWLGSVFLPEYI